MASAHTTVLGATVNLIVKDYDPGAQVLRIARRNHSIFSAKTVLEIFNTQTNSIIYDYKDPSKKGVFKVPKGLSGGDIELHLDVSDLSFLGSSTDKLDILLRLPSSLLPTSAAQSTATLISSSQNTSLEKIESHNSISIGDFGFAIINDNNPVVVDSLQ